MVTPVVSHKQVIWKEFSTPGIEGTDTITVVTNYLRSLGWSSKKPAKLDGSIRAWPYLLGKRCYDQTADKTLEKVVKSRGTPLNTQPIQVDSGWYSIMSFTQIFWTFKLENLYV